MSEKVVVFGGLTATGYLDQTWTFDGQNWNLEETVPAPPPRTNGMMAYDEPAGQLILFGGYGGGGRFLGDTWLWDGASSTWTQATTKTSPPGVTGPMVFTDPANGHVDVYGGYDGRFYQLRTWQWTGSDWLDLNPTNAPTPEAAASSLPIPFTRTSFSLVASVARFPATPGCGMGKTGPSRIPAFSRLLPITPVRHSTLF